MKLTMKAMHHASLEGGRLSRSFRDARTKREFCFPRRGGFAIEHDMLLRRVLVCGMMMGWLALWVSADAAAFKKLNGQVVIGEPAQANDRGILVRPTNSAPSEWIAWTNLTQETLRHIVTTSPKYREQAAIYLDEDEVEVAKKKRAEVKYKEGPQLARPDPKAGFGRLFTAPIMLAICGALYLANLYAAYEVSLFRNYHWGLVAGLSALVPVLPWGIFLCLPTRLKHSEEELAAITAQEQAMQEWRSATYTLPSEGQAAAATEEAPSAPRGPHPPPVVYQRGQTMFNRRFFETKLSGFLRMVPSDAEKDMILLVSSSRGEHQGTRISRLTPNEIFLHTVKGDSSAEVIIPFNEIKSIAVRHKDDA
jgi:hypothetical protein